ncbi:MAG: hypothetical protein ACRD1V_14370, partial [Vicinamibacterales bacterium]
MRSLGFTVLAYAVSVMLPQPGVHPAAGVKGTIWGRVELMRASTPAEQRPDVADVGAPFPRGVPDLRRSVVYLESAPRGAFEVEE